jgi:uncharacterized protein YkuJ
MFKRNVKANEIAILGDDTKKALYESRVVSLIRLRYSPNDETAILRKRLAGEQSEFDEYDAYVNECKRIAKREIYGE